MAFPSSVHSAVLPSSADVVGRCAAAVAAQGSVQRPEPSEDLETFVRAPSVQVAGLP